MIRYKTMRLRFHAFCKDSNIEPESEDAFSKFLTTLSQSDRNRFPDNPKLHGGWRKNFFEIMYNFEERCLEVKREIKEKEKKKCANEKRKLADVVKEKSPPKKSGQASKKYWPKKRPPRKKKKRPINFLFPVTDPDVFSGMPDRLVEKLAFLKRKIDFLIEKNFELTVKFNEAMVIIGSRADSSLVLSGVSALPRIQTQTDEVGGEDEEVEKREIIFCSDAITIDSLSSPVAKEEAMMGNPRVFEKCFGIWYYSIYVFKRFLISNNIKTWEEYLSARARIKREDVRKFYPKNPMVYFFNPNPISLTSVPVPELEEVFAEV